MDIREKAARMKAVSPFMSAASEDMRNQALQAIADAIEREKPRIIEENLRDLEAAEEKGIPAPVLKRLKFGEEKIGEVLAGIAELTGLADPLNKITLDRELDAGLRLCRQTCAIGVIGVIFEARPDAMVQVASLCIKSGNCAMLKGGSEAKRTNRKLFDVIYGAALSAGLPEGCLMLAETHDDIDNVLKCHESIDLLIPRGSNEFVQHIMNHTKIPVMGHADGVCHIYADRSADIEKAVPIILDAKTQYPAACNAAETLLVHREHRRKTSAGAGESFFNRRMCVSGAPKRSGKSSNANRLRKRTSAPNISITSYRRRLWKTSRKPSGTSIVMDRIIRTVFSRRTKKLRNTSCSWWILREFTATVLPDLPTGSAMVSARKWASASGKIHAGVRWDWRAL